MPSAQKILPTYEPKSFFWGNQLRELWDQNYLLNLSWNSLEFFGIWGTWESLKPSTDCNFTHLNDFRNSFAITYTFFNLLKLFLELIG